MSIIYEYLQLLEKKKKQNTPQPNAPVPISQKKKVSLQPYFIMTIVLIVGLSIFFSLKYITTSGSRWIEKTAPSQQNLNFTPQDFHAQGLNADNTSGLEYSLKGIIYNAESPSAIINSQLVEKNGKIDDWEVMEISPSEVRLENTSNKSLLTLKLNSPSGQ